MSLTQKADDAGEDEPEVVDESGVQDLVVPPLLREIAAREVSPDEDLASCVVDIWFHLAGAFLSRLHPWGLHPYKWQPSEVSSVEVVSFRDCLLRGCLLRGCSLHVACVGVASFDVTSVDVASLVAS